MRYDELTRDEYRRRAADMIMHFEGFHPRPYDARDGKATIGYGYTFNRDNNVELFDRAGITLTEGQRQHLAAIDAAMPGQRTALGLQAPIVLTRQQARDLLELASLDRYEDAANRMRLPYSDERAVVVSITYNRGSGRVLGDAMHPFRAALEQDDRAEAWYQIRYNSWGTSSRDEAGLRKRRGMEAQIFGLYEDPLNVTREEALSVYRMFELHRENIEALERRWGVAFDGRSERGANNIVAMANRDYPDLVRVYGRVPTITEALTPARDRLLRDLREQYPELADRLGPDAFPPLSVFVDPGRALRSPPFPRQTSAAASWPNSSAQQVSDAHAATLDARHVRNGVEQPRNDLLIGEGGDDVLRGGLGADLMLGGTGHDRYEVDAGDVVKDADGRGTLVWNGRVLDGGVLDPSTGHFRSADGAFTYRMDGARLTVANARGELVRIEGFRDGDLGIRLAPASAPAVTPPAGSPDPRHPDHPDHALYRQAQHAVHALDASLGRAPDGASERMIASVLRLAKENGFERIDHVVLSRQTGHVAGGQNVFVVQGAPNDPAALRAHMPTEQAVGTPVDESFRALQAIERHPGRSADRAVAYEYAHEPPVHQAPVLQRG